MSLSRSTPAPKISEKFLAIKDARDIADFLGIKYYQLIYNIHKISDEDKYAKFFINKRSGSKREITAPISPIKLIQKSISEAIYELYKPKKPVHGYAIKRGIKTNAQIHCNQRYLLNIDLKDFFPSINFGRVRGMFMAFPFNFNPQVATVLAQICCHENKLPQGAPTSPVISNIICVKLDKALLDIATKNGCYYSRYSDDLTFSTSHKIFSQEILIGVTNNVIKLNENLITIIESHGFKINTEKLKFQTKFQRQTVTGVVVNESTNVTRKYIRNVRAMLHAWKKFGHNDAEKEFFLKYDFKYRNPNSKKERPRFRDIVRGRVNYIGSIRKNNYDDVHNRKDTVFASLSKQLKDLLKEDKDIPVYNPTDIATIPLIVTEGKTDWQHMANALKHFQKKGLFKKLEIDFWRHDGNVNMNDIKLRSFCIKQKGEINKRKFICVFDRDTPHIIKEMDGDEITEYKQWGNNVFSFCIPVPSHRKLYKNISIEFYYTDKEVKTVDKLTGRQLLFTNDVEERKFVNLSTGKPTRKIVKLSSPIADDEYIKKVLDDKVDHIVDEKDKLIAHSKSVFAKNIYEEKKGFTDFDLKEFKQIFMLIQKISK